MGTISDKLTYLNTTKSQLKDMINYGLPTEEQITSSTTFRNYVSSIFKAFIESLNNPDTLFTNLPKKSGTGAVISLNGTANAPMRIELSPSELTQDATPTPSSPQAVHTISGSNKVVVCGKNLIPYQDKDFTISGINFKTINGNLILNGTATSSITGDMLVNDKYLKIDVEPTTYYLTRTNINSNLTINLMNEYNTVVAQLTRGSTDLSTTFSVSSINKVYLGFFIPQGATFNNYDGGIMISKNGGTYEPYISQEADIDLGYENLAKTTNCNVYTTNASLEINDGDIKINTIETNNNYDLTGGLRTGAWADTYSSATDYHLTPADGGSYVAKLFVKKLSGTGTASCHFKVFTNQRDITVYFNPSTTAEIKNSISLNQDEYIKQIAIWVNGGDKLNLECNIMLNKGTTALPYTPYNGRIEYCKIGNYEDKFIRTSGKNLFNPANNVWGKYNVWQNNAGNVTNAFTNTFEVKGGEKCSISFKCTTHNFRVSYQFIDNSNNYLAGNYWSVSSSSYNYTNVSIPATATKCIISQLDASQTDDIQIQFEYGSTATDYEPYGSKEWYIKKNIGKVVLDGSETITKTADTVTSNFSYALPQKSAVHDYSSTGKSNYFTPSYNNQVGKFYISGNALNLILCMENTYTLETFKTWLGTNNTIVYYPIETPTYTQITGTLANQLENVYQKLLSYSGTTNISQVNNGLAFNMTIQAIEQ